jgi:hypothetical protein
MRNVLFVIAGFGGPKDVEKKIEWLHHNIEVLNNNIENNRIKLLIFCYDDTEIILPESVKFEIEIIRQKGFVYQFLYRNVQPEYLKENNFEYFHALMDDVILSKDYDLTEVLNFYENMNCDIIQHSLAPGSTSNHMNDMKHIPGIDFSNSTHIEYFSYVMNLKSYTKYIALMDERTCCGWGLDVILPKYFKNLILYHKYPIIHFINGDAYKNQSFNTLEEYWRILRESDKILPIETRYEQKCSSPSDINEHLPVLRKYGSECNHITECGVRSVVSSYAFALSLMGKENNKLIQVDLETNENIRIFNKECKLSDINTVFYQMSDLDCPLEQTDLLFIDTWHVYGHLKRELSRWSSYVNKYIIMHDTTVDEWIGESIRMNMNIPKQIIDSGIPEDEIKKGLWPAIYEFLKEHSEWGIEKRYTNNNGLTILKRIETEKEVGFILTRHVNSEKTDLYWKECINQIRKFHPNNKIVIIDDNSDKKFLSNQKFENCEIIESEFPGRGELLAYYYFYKNKFFDKAIVIHDSIFIQSEIKNIPDKVKFLWDFEHYFDNEIEEINLLKNLNNSEKLIEFYIHKNLWKGCFGVMSIIDYEFLKSIQEKYNFFTLLNDIKTRDSRMNLERVFATICSYEISEMTKYPSIFGNIHSFIKWGYSYEQYIEDKNNNTINLPIIKVWTGR